MSDSARSKTTNMADRVRSNLERRYLRAELSAQLYEKARDMPLIGVPAACITAFIFYTPQTVIALSIWLSLFLMIYAASYWTLFRKPCAPTSQNYVTWAYRFIVFFCLYALMWASLVLISFPHMGYWQQLSLVLVLFCIVAVPAPVFTYCQPVAVLHPSIILLPSILIYLFAHPHFDRHSIAALVMLAASGVLISKQVAASRQVLLALSDRRELKTSLQAIALMTKEKHIDSTTGLLNAEGFREHLAHTPERPLCVLAIKFREVDELYALHSKSAADKIVWSIAQRLSSHIGPDAALSHTGFGEFLLLVQTSDSRKVYDTLQEIAHPAFLTDEGKLSFKIAIGAATLNEAAGTQDKIVDHAIMAMKHATQEDGDRYVSYTESLAEQITQTFNIRALIKKALNDQEFELFLQPKVDIDANVVKGAEALVRWNSPELGFVSPAKFIPIAESTGDIIPLGRFVLEKAAQMSCSSDLPANFSIAVNVSSKQFTDPQLLPLLERIAAKLRDSDRKMEIEITESMFISDSDAINTALGRIRELGYRIALDDFGTGYSSLSILTKLHADTLKLDKSFIDPIPADVNHGAFVASIIRMAHSLNLDMVAEGIESEAQLDWLAHQHCDVAQGYYFAKPLAFSEFIEWLRHSSSADRQTKPARTV